MSYEGHYQILCKEGHFSTMPCMYGGEDWENWKCEDIVDGEKCGSTHDVVNSVDDTNCDSYGYRKPILVKKAVTEKCPTCGHTHVTSDATYRLSEEVYFYSQSADDYVPVTEWEKHNGGES